MTKVYFETDYDPCIDPDWECEIKVHNWMNYVDPELRAIWGTFFDKQKIIIAVNFNRIAGEEEWE